MHSSERLSLFRSLRDKRVFVAGAGRQGMAAAQLARALGAGVVLGDDGDEKRILDSLRSANIPASDVDVCAGGIRAQDLLDADLVVLSAGLPRSHPAIRAAIENQIPICNEIELGAAQLQESTIVGITGTNGKSTTTTMLGDILRGHDPDTFVGGNLGTPLCEVIARGERPRMLVLELSSYQLETIQTLELAVAVVTNLAPDHLDRYPSVEAYYEAKKRIFSLLSADGVAVVNRTDALSGQFLNELGDVARLDFGVSAEEHGVQIGQQSLVLNSVSTSAEISLENPNIVGLHNRQNAAAAVAAAGALGIETATLTAGLRAYAGISHRLERLGTARGVTWFNDSKATNVEAARTAIQSFSAGVHLIAGGVGKGASYQPLVDAAQNRVVQVYAIGEDAAALVGAFSEVVDVQESTTLAAAVAAALECAAPGDVLLLAPACASFDQFSNYQARGDAFRQLFEAALEET